MSDTRSKLLALLRSQPAEGFLSGQQAAEALGVSRAAVCKAAAGLRRQGYQIQAVTRRGYRLASEDAPLTRDGLLAALEHWQAPVEVWPSLPSTNLRARQLALDGAPAGTVVAALCQTQGRGRFGRVFESPPGGLYLSMVLRPEGSIAQALTLTAAAAVAVCRAVEECCGVSLSVKWVNDLVLDGKKCGGILTEGAAALESGRLEYLIVGIGLNLCTLPEDFSPAVRPVAASLYPGLAPLPVHQLAASLCRQLAWLCFDPQPEQFLPEYRRRSCVLGHHITVHPPAGQPYAAFAQAIDDQGRLVVRLPAGGVQTLQWGEVSVRSAGSPPPEPASI